WNRLGDLGPPGMLPANDCDVGPMFLADVSKVLPVELVRLAKKSSDPNTATRFLIIARLAAPERPSKTRVARELEVAVSSVVNAARRYLLGGPEMLYDQRVHNGRGRKVDETFRLNVSAALYLVPPDRGWERPMWTRELLCLEMVERGLPRIAVCTMSRVLAELGARLGSPKPIVVCPWRAPRRRRVLRELKALADGATDAEPVFYADEVDIHLNPKIGRDWMPRGFQSRVVTPGRNEKHYVAGALNAKTRRLITVEAPRKNSRLFCDLVERLVAEHPAARRIHIILDNYIIHSSKITQRFLAQERQIGNESPARSF
ncbi:MAG: IS630 family transposase, partial [Deltaproteobacteria bacterium]|nr:IS630 family transposase [Deltaproteobacteria bacterium]